MKKYIINNIKTSKAEFERQLKRCFTKSSTLAAGAASGYFDAERYAEIKDKVCQGWEYTCAYAPAGINLVFKTQEVKK